MPKSTLRLAAVCAIVIALTGSAWWLLRHRGMTSSLPASIYPASTYVDAQKCAGCHHGIHDSYGHMGMARSFGAISRVPQIEDYAHNNQFVHAASGRHYEVLRRGTQVFQRRFEVDSKGRETNAFEQEVNYAVGSGNHARTYLHRSENGELTELPVSWYTQEKRWGMSPGFDNSRPADFIRLVDDRCLFCHNAYPASNGTLAQGIDCQRCHGPGARHVQLAGSGKAAQAEVQAAIVNPAKLSPERQMDVCMQCHLETTSTELPSMVRRFDRDVNSFRPGEALTDYVVQFDEAPGTGRAGKFEIVNQAYRLRQSACFLKSSGKLTCTVCHNPHQVARGDSAVVEYRKACAGCHRQVTAANHPSLQDSNCIECHMPKRRAEDAVHVVMTDHLIQRKPASALIGKLAENAGHPKGTPALYYPERLPAAERDLYLGVALITNGASRREGIAMLERQVQKDAPAKAMAVLGEGYLAEGNASAAIAMFGKALAKDPALFRAHYNLAEAYAGAGQTGEAMEEYGNAIRAHSGFAEAEYAMGNLLVKSGKISEAAAHYQNAIRARGTYPEAHSNLGNLYGAQGSPAKAQEELEQALRIEPGLVEGHNNLARVLAAQHKLPEALEHLRRALVLDPNFLEPRYNLARVLQETGAADEAIAEYRRVLAQDPTFVPAHVSLAQALGDKGMLDAAVLEFREAIRLQPGNADAQRGLEMALGLKNPGRP